MESVYEKCPFVTTQRVLKGKWAIVVLYQLSTGTKRFNELEKSMPEVTRTVLTRQLRQLEKDKLIERKVYAEVPPRVEYRLKTLKTGCTGYFATIFSVVNAEFRQYRFKVYSSIGDSLPFGCSHSVRISSISTLISMRPLLVQFSTVSCGQAQNSQAKITLA